MNSSSLRTTFAAVTVMLVAVCVFQTRSAQSSSATTSPSAAKPLLLEKNEGERRIWREPPPGDFILKVSPQNNGSQHLVMEPRTWLPATNFHCTGTSRRMSWCTSKKEPFTLAWGTRNVICTQEARCSSPQTPGSI